MDVNEAEAAVYVPLSLVPQPLKHPRPGQLGLKAIIPSSLRVKQEKEPADRSLSKTSTPESAAALLSLKEKYQLGSDTGDAAAAVDSATSKPQQPITLVQRQHVLQHLAQFKQRAAAIKSTAAAVQEWFEWGGPAAASATDALSAEALLVLNAEANKGLLHMLGTGLVPCQLELTPGLCGRPDAPFYSKPTQLHPSEAKHAAAAALRNSMSVWQAPKPPPAAKKVVAAKTATANTCSSAAPHPKQETTAAGAQSVEVAATAAHQPRGYEDLLDALSEHQLLIFRGKLVQNTPQVVSFIRVAAPSWRTVSALLSQLEAVCRVFKVPLAVIDGKEVLQLALDLRNSSSSGSGTGDSSSGSAVISRPAVGLPELLGCIANLNEVEHLFNSVSEEMAAGATDTDALNNTAPAASAVAGEAPAAASNGVNSGQQQQPDTGLTVPTAAKAQKQQVPAKSVNAAGKQKIPKQLQQAQGPLLETMVQARRDRDAAFQLLQHSLRHNWQQVQQQRHIVLHLPSLPAAQQHQQQSYNNQPCQQQHQLWRLLGLLEEQARAQQPAASSTAEGDPNSSAKVASKSGEKGCHVLVSSQPVNKQLQAHWMQLLKLTGVTEPSNRIRFVTPDALISELKDLPAALPLAAHLMMSEKALSHCKQIITGYISNQTGSADKASAVQDSGSDSEAAAGAQQTNSSSKSNSTQQLPLGYIIPGCPCEHDVDVAVKLGLPILGPTPQLAQVLASRVGARSLFAAAGICVPAGCVLPRSSHSTTDEAAWQQLLSGMCMQLLQWPHQQQWMMKLNQLRGTMGLAMLDLTTMQETQAAVDSAAEQLKLHQQQKHQLQQKPETGPAIDLSSVPADQLQMTLQQLLLALAGELHLGLQLAQQSYWQQRATGVGYTAAAGDMEVTEAAVEVYLTELLKQGGVMEVYLDQLVCCPLVQLLVEPGGVIKVIASQDKILHGGFSSPGSTFPSGCPAHAALIQTARAAGEAAMAAGMLGYLQVAFLCTSNPARRTQQQQLQQQQLQQQQLQCQAAARSSVEGLEKIGSGSDSQNQVTSNDAVELLPEVLLWGCDLLPWPSPDLALFKLFDAVQQGSFDTVTGQYMAALKNSASTLSVPQESPQAARYQQQQQQQQDAGRQQQQIRQCHYACLHNPAAVFMHQHLSDIVQNCLPKQTVYQSKQPGSRTVDMQALQVQLGSFGTSGDVIVCLDSDQPGGSVSQHPDEVGKQRHTPQVPAGHNSSSTATVSGIICCSNSSGAVGALSCLSALITRYDGCV